MFWKTQIQYNVLCLENDQMLIPFSSDKALGYLDNWKCYDLFSKDKSQFSKKKKSKNVHIS